jgi:hypothetical protein
MRCSDLYLRSVLRVSGQCELFGQCHLLGQCELRIDVLSSIPQHGVPFS